MSVNAHIAELESQILALKNSLSGSYDDEGSRSTASKSIAKKVNKKAIVLAKPAPEPEPEAAELPVVAVVDKDAAKKAKAAKKVADAAALATISSSSKDSTSNSIRAWLYRHDGADIVKMIESRVKYPEALDEVAEMLHDSRAFMCSPAQLLKVKIDLPRKGIFMYHWAREVSVSDIEEQICKRLGHRGYKATLKACYDVLTECTTMNAESGLAKKCDSDVQHAKYIALALHALARA